MQTPEPIGPIMRANILNLAKVYQKHRQLTDKSLSTYCHGDPPFLEKLRSDPKASVTGRKYDHVINWFFENWPVDLAMPPIRPFLTDSVPRKFKRSA